MNDREKGNMTEWVDSLCIILHATYNFSFLIGVSIASRESTKYRCMVPRNQIGRISIYLPFTCIATATYTRQDFYCGESD